MRSTCLVYRPADPVGVRCSHARLDADKPTVNSWQWFEEISPEIEALVGNTLDPVLTEAEHADVKANLMILITLATKAALYVSDLNGEASTVRETLLELRPSDDSGRTSFGQPPRWVRLYFGEPAQNATALVGLHLATKRDYSDGGRDEQNASIELALDRADRWAAA